MTIPTDGPARATRGPTPVNSPFMPPDLPENNISKQQITIMSILIKPITKLELRKKYMEVRSSTSPILPFTFEQF